MHADVLNTLPEQVINISYALKAFSIFIRWKSHKFQISRKTDTSTKTHKYLNTKFKIYLKAFSFYFQESGSKHEPDLSAHAPRSLQLVITVLCLWEKKKYSKYFYPVKKKHFSNFILQLIFYIQKKKNLAFT